MTAYDMNTLEKYYENFDAYVNPHLKPVFSSYNFQYKLQKT